MALSDDAVQQAAGALLRELQSSGCKPGFSPTVQAFQQAYVTAGGPLPNDSSGKSGIDGLYGRNTQAALQAVLDASPTNQPPQQAPAGCVGGGGGGGGAVVPSGGGAMTTTGGDSARTMWLAAAAAVVLAGGIWYYSKHHKRKR